MNEERWHVSQYAQGELISHHVYPDWEYARAQIHRKGLLMGVNVLARASKCECRGRMS